jgi:sigma-B regulation protein RsbU (phosphoserine phosphatase)
MESELAIGRDIQMNMLTLTVPSFPKRNDLNLYAALLPAREVGGDFYDFYFFRRDTSYLYLLEGNRFCFCVGDVSGKGVPAALYMAVTKTLIKSQANIDLSPSKILSHVNQVLSADNESCMFVTLFFGVLNLVNGELVYTNAGHNPPYIQRQDGSLTELDKGHGPAMGVVENLAYKESKTMLQTGDILLAYTDGVTEAMDSQKNLFSDERLISFLKTRSFQSSEDIINATLASVAQFQGEAEQADDLTLLAVQFLGEPEAQQDDLLELSIRDEVLSNLREQWEKT